MARKKAPEEHENHERWLVSYADFITLLFAFFVVMYSISSVNEGKYRVLSDSLLTAFRSAPKSLDPIQVGKPSKSPVLSELQFKSSPNILISQRKGIDFVKSDGAKELVSTENIKTTPEYEENLGKISDDIMLAMANLIELGLINVRRNDLWLEIEIKSSILYGSGSAKLKESVIPVIKKIANVLYKFPNAVRVEGYTDSYNISTAIYPSNWELSSARASSIARLFEMSNILSERLSVVGYGPTRPIADNSTAEGRSTNRRVIIVIVANNDVSKTIKNTKQGAAPFPETALIIEDGLVEKYIEPIVVPVVEFDEVIVKSKLNDVEINSVPDLDRGLSIFRESSGSNAPLSSITKNKINVINPLLSAPIRLFSPIVLPTPINLQNQSVDSTE